MKNYKHYFSISLLTMICAIVGGLIYSQTGVAKSNDKKNAGAAATTELLSYESANFKYKQIATNEVPPANFESPTFDDSGWNTGNAAFGGGGGGCLSETVRTNWDVNSRLLVRKVVNVPANSTNLKIYIAIDNNVEGVFVNGSQVGGTYLHGCATRDSVVYQVPDNLLLPGENLVVYHLYDYGVASYFDTRITADINPVCTPLPLNAISWFPASNNFNDIVTGNNGSPIGIVDFSEGKVGTGFHLMNSVVRTSGNYNFSGTNEITLESWFKFDSHAGYSGIMGAEGCCTFRLMVSPDNRIFYNAGTHTDIEVGPLIQLNQFNHAAMVIRGGSTAQIYLNGQLISESSNGVPTVLGNVSVFHFGGGESSGLHLVEDGVIDEPTIYNQALSSAEILAIYNAGSAGKCQNGVLASITLNPASVNSGQTSTGTIALVNPAPSSSRTINLTSSDTNLATVPASITISEGQTSGTFTVSTTAVLSDTPITISAEYQTETRTAVLNVLAPKPDLQSVIINAPATSNTDAAFNLSWTDRNNGSGAASGTWTDKVYISADNQVGNDTLLGDFPFSGTIAPNQSIDRIQSVSIPNSAIPTSGNYFLIVVTDANNDINEGTNENNNFSVRAINVTRTPLPDLTIENITAPNTAFFGQTIRVQWTVKNIGDGPTNAAEWQDWYYISSDDLPELQDPFKAPLQNISYLAAGESYTASADVTIPQGLIGSYKILVYTDSNGLNFPGNVFSVRESDEFNNWNNARPIQINAPPLPDLQTTLVQAQEEAFNGQPFLINWRVENRGDGTTPPSVPGWNDKIYLSQNTTFEPNVDRLIGSRQHTGVLLQMTDIRSTVSALLCRMILREIGMCLSSRTAIIMFSSLVTKITTTITTASSPVRQC